MPFDHAPAGDEFVPPIATANAVRPAVGYVLSAFPVLSETFVSNEIREMRRLGHRIVPIALSPAGGRWQPDDDALARETLRLPDLSAAAALRLAGSPGGLARAWAFCRRQTGIRPRSLFWAGLRVAAAARRAGCRHLHAHFAHSAAATAIVAARALGVPVTFTAHGYDVYGSPCDLSLKLASASAAVAVCNDMVEDFLRLAPSARVAMVPCGVDPLRFLPGAGPDNGRLLAVGRLVEQKGFDILIQALALVPSGHRPGIDIVGDGPLEPALRTAMDRLGIAASLRLLGSRPAAWIASHAPAYRGFVAPFRLTAEGDRDTGPVVVKEAMAMGLPILASRLMGLKEIVAPDCGRQVTPADATELADGLRWLGGIDGETRARLGSAGRRRVIETFTLRHQAAGLSSLIADLSGARAAG
ncbi:colanic acid biosynthesis glycosyltransferase WcaL [Allostella sp. ATCC 35155]|nr:colanic acid biosynthesis glycosyltransferase WcaL [Stella sp. ATCC 35155]